MDEALALVYACPVWAQAETGMLQCRHAWPVLSSIVIDAADVCDLHLYLDTNLLLQHRAEDGLDGSPSENSERSASS